MRLALQPATRADRPFCESLDRTSMAPYRSARGVAWDPQRFRASWDEFENFMIMANGRAVGSLRLLALPGTLEIRDLQVLPARRCHGIGTWAILQAMEAAAGRGLSVLRLRVFEENPAAALYARLGFEIEAMDDGTLHMACKLQAGDAIGAESRSA